MDEYNEGFKEAMVKKMTGPGAPSATALSNEVGVSQSTLSRWLREYGTLKGSRRGSSVTKGAKQWDAEQKLKVIIEYEGLHEEARGRYLREKGLFSVEIDRWRTEILGALGKRPKKGDAKSQRIRELEAELRRKEKALAEAAALLVLKKKVQEIWGDREDGK